MTTSAQLEREAEATRAQISTTLDELRSRMTAGQMVDQLVDYARDSGGAEFVRNLGRQVAGNPLPVTLVGAGLAWLMLAGRRAPPGPDGAASDDIAAGMSQAGRRRETGGQVSANVADLSEHAVRRAREWARQTHATAERLNQRAGEAGADLQDTMSAAGANVRDAAAAAYDTASATYDAAAERARRSADALGRTARTMSDSLAAGGQNMLGFLQEQPLVLAGLGLAIGGLLGASLPSSETEDQLMGDASDTAKGQVKSFAQEQVDKGQQVAKQAWNAARPEIDAQLRDGNDEPGGEATLVPADQATQGETAGDGARHGTEHSS